MRRSSFASFALTVLTVGGALVLARVDAKPPGSQAPEVARAMQPQAAATPRCQAQPLPMTHFSDIGTTLRTIVLGSQYYTGAPLPRYPTHSSPPGAPASVVVKAPRTPLLLFVARDPQQRERGLMCITKMEPQVGMIFVFPSEQQQNFWMKNTLIPLDMVFVGSDGTVESVAPKVPASTFSTPDNRVATRAGSGQFVIELNSGEAAADGIVRGAHLQLPALQANE